MASAFSCALLGSLLGLSLAGCAGAPTSGASSSVQPSFYQPLDRAEAQIDPIAARDLFSIYRTGKGLPALSVDPDLQRLAQAQVQEMARKAKPDLQGSPLAQRLKGAQLTRRHAVENVSAGYHTLAEAFSGWRQSPPHNANMLDPAVRRMGIATAYVPGSKYHVFWALVLTE